MPRRVFRYPGLVRTMREVRIGLGRPLSSAERAGWTRYVRRVLAEAEAAAGEAGLTPLALPRASRQAYQYLAGLDLDRSDAQAQFVSGEAVRPMRIARLIRARDRFLEKLQVLSRRPATTEVASLRDRMIDLVGDVGVLCEREGSSPAALPEPSRRAYQWMSFLSEPGRIEAHLRALADAARADPRIWVDLFHLGGLYRFAWKGGTARFTLSEAFIDASPQVLSAAVKLAVPYSHKRKHRRTVRSYASSPDFELRWLQLETSGGSFAESAGGVVHDLESIFADVNRRQFGGRLSRPRLSWLATTSMREFGHYVVATDLVLVSSQLDAPHVPRFVVEHVVHHELLHREMGAVGEGGRRVYHTAAFRQAEQRFPRFEEADAFLENFARTALTLHPSPARRERLSRRLREGRR